MCYNDIEDRRLFYDGKSSYNSNDIIKLRKKYDIKYVNELTDIVKEYNKYCSYDNQLVVKTTCDSLSPIQWNIPIEFQLLDVVEYVFNKHIQLTSSITDSNEILNRDIRLINEIKLFKQLNYFDIIRLMIYIITKFEEHDIIYGVGRGSATSSYLLYIIGVHDVDSYLYDLDINDFLHS